mgnify:CR=1 FL=1
MKIIGLKKVVLITTVMVSLFLPNATSAAECPEGTIAVTNSDPNISEEILSLQVNPLTKCELEIEAKAWLLLLKNMVTEISNTEMAAINKKELIEITPDSENKLATARDGLILQVSDLVADRAAITDRFQIVLKELTAKGGTTEEYDSYIGAVSGIKVDVTDANATWTIIKGWVTSPEGGFRWIMNLAQFLLIVVVFYVLSILAAKATLKATSKSKQLSVLLSDFLVMASRRLIFVIGFFIGLSALEVDIGPVLAIIGAAGFVIAFALQNSLSNFASGILMLMYRPFDLGDVIDVAGVLGKVESMNLLSTQLRTLDNKLVIVPNNSVWGDVITNVTGITERRVDMMFGIGYSDDIDKTVEVLENILSSHELVLKDPEPVVKMHELGDSSVNFVCRPWVKTENYWEVYWDITREVKRRFDAEGISIPFPQRDVHIYQET